MRSCSRFRPDGARAFTLLEVLVALAVAMLILVTALTYVSQIEQTWKANATDSFAEAQAAFDAVTQNLASATLNPYQDLADSSGAFRTNGTASFVPDHPARRSDLAFVCGPVSGSNGLLSSTGRKTTGSSVFFVAAQGYTQTYAHSGLERLLNARGYVVEFGDDEFAPAFLPTGHRWRWRLKQVRQPSEDLHLFSIASSSDWIGPLVPSGTALPVMADNIVALIVLPERTATDAGAALASDYRYDSRDAGNRLTLHQLPPRLRVALVAMDETSAAVLAAKNGTQPPVLVAGTLFQESAKLDVDLVTLDQALVAQKIHHRLFQREIQLPGADWSNTPSP